MTKKLIQAIQSVMGSEPMTVVQVAQALKASGQLPKLKPEAIEPVDLICTGKGSGNHGCGALVHVEQKDLYRTASNGIQVEREFGVPIRSFATFVCPTCKEPTNLSPDLEPRNLHAMPFLGGDRSVWPVK